MTIIQQLSIYIDVCVCVFAGENVHWSYTRLSESTRATHFHINHHEEIDAPMRPEGVSSRT